MLTWPSKPTARSEVPPRRVPGTVRSDPAGGARAADGSMIVRGRVEVTKNTGVLWIGAAAGGNPSLRVAPVSRARSWSTTCATQEGAGIDAITSEIVDLLAAGVIDPAMVMRSALQNAVSIAKNILTT